MERALYLCVAGAPGNSPWCRPLRRPPIRLKKYIPRFLLALVSTVVALAALEAGLRLKAHLSDRRKIPLHVVCGDRAFLYRLNPEHSEISAQGLRDRPYAIPKPAEVLRILVLGDSVAYGPRVSRDMTFPKRLEQLHDRQTGQLEVVNASVNGYMPYNELHFYLAEGRAYQADIVIVAFCMNDIVDPELHWGYRGGGVKRIPQEAIPNPDYHTNHVVPIMERMRQSTVWERFALYRSLRPRVWRIQGPQQPQGEPHVRVCGRQWPTHVTTEDSISIQVLTDYDSPEWRWLRSIYDQLHTAVLKEGAALLVLILPLAYQLDPEYPFIPQELIKRYCKTSSILCLDVLPAFRKHRDEKLFFRTGSDYDYDDIWHLTERGHQLVAEEVEVFLVEHRLVDPG